MATLSWIDYVVFSSFLCISLAIGFYHACTGGKQKSAGEFISGNRRMRMIPVMLSLVLSYISAILILGTTAEIYKYSIQAWFCTNLTFIIACVFAERVFVPWIYDMKITSVYEYLLLRYQSRLVHACGVILGLTYLILYMGTAIFAPALALEAVTGFRVSATISIMAIVCTIYTAMGGMKAVVYTDVFQGGVLFIGCLAILIKALFMVGGLGNAFEVVKEDERLVWTQFDLDPRVRHTLWGFLFGMSWTFGVMFGLSQPSVQRYCALPTKQRARQVVGSSAIPFVVVNIMLGLVGVSVYAYYSITGCDPLESGTLFSHNQLVPYFVVTNFQAFPGVSGLFMAALFSGAMSSISSGLSSAAAVAWQDLVKQNRPQLSDFEGAIINKILVVVFAAMTVGVAFLAASLPGVPIMQTAVTFCSVSMGPLGGLFILGGVSRKVNWKGALTGAIAGLILTFWIGVGAMTITPPYKLAPPASIENCPSAATNTSAYNYTYTTSSTDYYGVNTSSLLDVTAAADDVTGEKETEISGIQHLYTLSYMWISLLGSLVSIGVGLLVSVCTGRPEDQTHLKDDMFFKLSDILASPCAQEETLQLKHTEEMKPLNGKTHTDGGDMNGNTRANDNQSSPIKLDKRFY